ncbi:MAG: hypothetical protein RLO80_12830 [Hyphomonas sp.]
MKKLSLLATRVAGIFLSAGLCLSVPAVGQGLEQSIQSETLTLSLPADSTLSLESNPALTEAYDMFESDPLNGLEFGPLKPATGINTGGVLEPGADGLSDLLDRLKECVNCVTGINTGTGSGPLIGIRTPTTIVPSVGTGSGSGASGTESGALFNCSKTDESPRCSCVRASKIFGMSDEETIKACKDK